MTTFVIVALEPVAAFHLKSLFRAALGPAAPSITLLENPHGPDPATAAWLDSLPAPAHGTHRLLVTGTDLLSWLNRFHAQNEDLRAVYLRSSAATVWDLISAESSFRGSVGAIRGRFIECADHNLACFPQLSAEDLYFDPASVLTKLASLIGLPPEIVPQHGPSPDAGTAYNAMITSLRRLGGEDGDGLAAMAGFRPGKTCPVGHGRFGSILLASGWSHPERTQVWSDGDCATLVVPIPPDAEGPLLCRLSGWVIKPDFRLRASIDGAPVGTFHWPEEAGRGAVIDIPILLSRRRSTAFVTVRLEMESALQPPPPHPVDRRRLGLALTAIQIYAAQSGPDCDDPSGQMIRRLLDAGYRHAPLAPTPPSPSPHDADQAGIEAVLRSAAGTEPSRLAVVVSSGTTEDIDAILHLCQVAGAELLVVAGPAPSTAPADTIVLLTEDDAASTLARLDGLKIRPALLAACDPAAMEAVLGADERTGSPRRLGGSMFLARTRRDEDVTKMQHLLGRKATPVVSTLGFSLAIL